MEFKLDESLEKNSDQVQSSLNQGAQAGLALAAALEKARQAAKALASTSSRVKRVLAGFDEITRLGETKKSSSSSRKKSTAKEEVSVPEEEVDTRPSLEMQNIEVSPLPGIFSKLIGLADIIEVVERFKAAMQSLWQDTLVPFGAWVIQTLIPGIGDYFRFCFERNTQTMIQVVTQLQESWQTLKTGALTIFENIGQTFTRLKERFTEVVNQFLFGSTQAGDGVSGMGQQVGGVVGTVLEVLGKLKTGWDTIFGGLKTVATTFGNHVVNALQAVADFLKGGFTKSWGEGFAGLKSPVEGIINSIIGFLNKMLSGLTSALNGVINAANKLKFTVPDWVPGIGGKSYGFSLKTVSVPQIPYLAKGAVLPANQPFLAVVGDQKHGTNVEAPLSTIQEAVAAVMDSHTAGNMAGHEATVAVLRQILEAVLGIDVGEAVVARAAQSYKTKNAVMRGGSY